MEALLVDTPVASVLAVVWPVMLALTFLLHVAVYTFPRRLVPYNALPWAFRFESNLDLDFQTVTYAAVHDKRIARWSHLTLPLEQVAWAIVLLSVHPLALAVVLLIVAAQAALLREPPLAFALVATWLGVSALGVFALGAVGPAALLSAQILLLIGPILRFVGHAFEPIPPFVGSPRVGGPRDAFLPLSETRLGLAAPLLVAGGIVSEFAAALPHRLIVVQVFWLAQRLGYTPRVARDWPRARALGAAIRADGWKAYDKTRWLFQGDAVPTAKAASDA